MKLKCGSCDWERPFDQNDLSDGVAAMDEFDAHEAETHPTGAFVQWVHPEIHFYEPDRLTDD